MRMQPWVMARPTAWDCWSVDLIRAVAEAEPDLVVAQGVVGSWADHGGQGIAGVGVFLAHRGRRVPGGVGHLGDDPGLSERRALAQLADADGIGDDHPPAVLFGLGESSTAGVRGG